MNISKGMRQLASVALMATPIAVALMSGDAIAQAKNGTTLAAYKTIDVCSVNDTTWRYTGEIAVWNEGVIDTVGLTITDYIQTKVGNVWKDTIPVPLPPITEIPAGTTKADATLYKYQVDDKPLPNGVRNSAVLTILNHSGAMGKPKGPEPKATLMTAVAPCPTEGHCVYTQGYWGNKPNVVWPYLTQDTLFYNTTATWQQVMDTANGTSPGYYSLAHQFIAAVQNQANGALVPSGVQDTITLADAWFKLNGPEACTAKGSCGTQKDWAKVLGSYNQGGYPNGPAHCGDDEYTDPIE